jgi:hypothetical protein
VHVTLDTAKAQTGTGLTELSGQTANGASFIFQLPEDLLSQEADGTLMPAYGTPVTLTPVSTIADIPFSQGFLAAVQLAPDGLIMAEPATLLLTIPGEHNPDDLVGFAADGNGDNFHLYPAVIDSGGGQTIVMFDVMHFSLYGVALATSQEIEAQHAQVPNGTTAQDEDELAPLVPKKINNLAKQNETKIAPVIDSLDNLNGNCNKVAVAAQSFITWYARVVQMNAVSNFNDVIAHDTQVLSGRLNDCLKIVCPFCVGKAGDKHAPQSFLVLAFYAEQIANIAGNSSEAARWRDLANSCAQNAGIPLPHVVVCDTCAVSGESPTITPVCP